MLSDLLLFVPPLLFFYFLYRGKPAPQILSLFLLSGALAASLKLLFRIGRDVGVDPFTFPSIHSALGSSLFFAYPHPLTLLYALVMMALRVVEGYHGVVDVLGGFLTAGLAALLYYSLKERIGLEADRKSIHFGVAVLAGYFGLFVDQLLLATLLLAGALVLHLLKKWFLPLFELYGRGERDFGPLTLALGLFVGSLINVMPLVGFVLGYVDGLAAIFGKLFGRRRLPSGKTLEGFLGGVLGGILVAFLLRGFYPASVLAVIPLLAAVVEANNPSDLDDNVVLSVFVSGAYWATCCFQKSF